LECREETVDEMDLEEGRGLRCAAEDAEAAIEGWACSGDDMDMAEEGVRVVGLSRGFRLELGD
jgi:hypothetical protein